MVATNAVIVPPVLVHVSWAAAGEGGSVTDDGVRLQVRPVDGAVVTERLMVSENELPPAIVIVDRAELPVSVNTDDGLAVMAKSLADTTTIVKVRTEPR